VVSLPCSFGAHTAETTRASKRIVVLPFTNLGPAGQEYFADGVTEEITARLAAVGGLAVIGSTSATAYKGTKKTILDIGRSSASRTSWRAAFVGTNRHTVEAGCA